MNNKYEHSPLWLPVAMLTAFICGVAVIVGNYLNLLPGGAANQYLFVGIGLIGFGFILATQYK